MLHIADGEAFSNAAFKHLSEERVSTIWGDYGFTGLVTSCEQYLFGSWVTNGAHLAKRNTNISYPDQASHLFRQTVLRFV